VLHDLHSTSEFCYSAINEHLLELVLSKKYYTDTENIINNVVYNFGSVFDSVRDTYVWFADGPDEENAYEAGFGFGHALFLSVFRRVPEFSID